MRFFLTFLALVPQLAMGNQIPSVCSNALGVLRPFEPIGRDIDELPISAREKRLIQEYQHVLTQYEAVIKAIDENSKSVPLGLREIMGRQMLTAARRFLVGMGISYKSKINNETQYPFLEIQGSSKSQLTRMIGSLSRHGVKVLFDPMELLIELDGAKGAFTPSAVTLNPSVLVYAPKSPRLIRGLLQLTGVEVHELRHFAFDKGEQSERLKPFLGEVLPWGRKKLPNMILGYEEFVSAEELSAFALQLYLDARPLRQLKTSKTGLPSEKYIQELETALKSISEEERLMDGRLEKLTSFFERDSKAFSRRLDQNEWKLPEPKTEIDEDIYSQTLPIGSTASFDFRIALMEGGRRITELLYVRSGRYTTVAIDAPLSTEQFRQAVRDPKSREALIKQANEVLLARGEISRQLHQTYQSLHQAVDAMTQEFKDYKKAKGANRSALRVRLQQRHQEILDKLQQLGRLAHGNY